MACACKFHVRGYESAALFDERVDDIHDIRLRLRTGRARDQHPVLATGRYADMRHSERAIRPSLVSDTPVVHSTYVQALERDTVRIHLMCKKCTIKHCTYASVEKVLGKCTYLLEECLRMALVTQFRGLPLL